MNFSTIGKIAIGAALGTAATYVFCRKTVETTKNSHNHDIGVFTDEINNRDKTITTMRTENDKLNDNYQKLVDESIDMSNALMSVGYTVSTIIDPNMIADIAKIKDLDTRNNCLAIIDSTITELNDIISSISFQKCSDDPSKTYSDMMAELEEIRDNMCGKISAILESCKYDDDDDDDDDYDDEEMTISPKKIIFHSIDGSSKIFETDPDDGFAVLEGSNIEDNNYRIIAQNIPSLNNFLLTSIKDQLSKHYAMQIDSDTFDAILEDMVIIISLAYINEEDCDITSVDAVVPFEFFKDMNGNKIYFVNEGEIDVNNAIRYFGSTSSNSASQSRENPNPKNTIDEKSETSETSEMVDNITYEYVASNCLSEETINFIVDTIGYNKDALKSFVAKLRILMKANPEAGKSIYDAFSEGIVADIYQSIKNDEFDYDVEYRITARLRALIANMKKNYSADIKAYNSSN